MIPPLGLDEYHSSRAELSQELLSNRDGTAKSQWPDQVLCESVRRPKRRRKYPFQAHIRKVNPRGELDKKCDVSPDSSESESKHRITRCGIPYGERQKALKDNLGIEELPTAGVAYSIAPPPRPAYLARTFPLIARPLWRFA
jgi:deferrochelatase/peroxidase EfeB